MKMLKKLLFVLLALTLMFAFISCTDDDTCTAHIDEDENGLCDKCGETVEPADNGGDGESVALIKDGEAIFQIVYEEDIPTTVKLELQKLVTALNKIGFSISVVADKNDNIKDCEILFGNVKSRGEKYQYDYHKLGPEGKVMKIVDNKVIIAGGSEDTMLSVLSEFKNDILGLDSDTEEIFEVLFTSENEVEKFTDKDSYRNTSVSIGGKSAENFKIIADLGNSYAKSTVRYIQNFFYTKVGYWLEAVDIDSVTDKTDAIVVEIQENTRKGNGYSASVSGTTLYIKTEFPNVLESTTDAMLGQMFGISKGDLKVASTFSFTKNVRDVYYSDYAKANNLDLDTTGKKNAYSVMKAVHNYANKYGHTVKAKSGETYLIGEISGSPITIKTDVDWGSANIIIDDRTMSASSSSRQSSVFLVESDYKKQTYDANSDIVKLINESGGIDKDEINSSLNFFNFKTGYEKAMVIPINSDHKVYIRYGTYVSNSGDDQAELIIIDKDGNIDPSTPFLLDYNKVTKIEVHSVDDTPITINGGIITTRANAVDCYYAYFSRNILVQRSNVTIDGLVHKVTDEGDRGAPYTGFIFPQRANNLTVKNTTLQAHKTYVEEQRDENGNKLYLSDGKTPLYGSNMGTYDLGGTMSNGLYYINCNQSNMFDNNGEATTNWRDENGETGMDNRGLPATLWGIMGTNYCKNIVYDNCDLNRLDAHAGVINASIINGSYVLDVALTGGGTALIEDSTIHHSSRLIALRDDYGSTWNGDIKIINCTFKTTASTATILKGVWYNHYFGYQTYMPANVIIDNLKVVGTTNVNVFSTNIGNTDVTAENIGVNENINRMVITEKIIIRNNNSNLTFNVSDPGFLAGAIELVIED